MAPTPPFVTVPATRSPWDGSTVRARRPRRVALVVALAAATLAAGCGGSAGSPTPVPNPSAACGGADEQRAPGFYPDLERLLPAHLATGQQLTAVESGRYCSAATLGSLTAAGIDELRFAGARAELGGDVGVSVTALTARGLTLDRLADSYANGAGAARRVASVHAGAVEVGGHRGIRIDAFATSGQRQVVVLWESGQPDVFYGVIGSGVSEDVITAAENAFASR